jgi:hypothetical protein
MQLMGDKGYAFFEEQLKAFARNRVFNEQRSPSIMTSDSALYTVSRKKKSQVVCYNCSKKGHKSFQCPEKKDRKKNEETSMFATGEDIQMAFAAFSESVSKDGWVVDSGCTTHMCNEASAFEKVYPTKQKQIYLANGQTLAVNGEGTVCMKIVSKEGRMQSIFLDQVLFVPGLKNNLFSVQKTAEKGHSLQFGRGSAVIKTARGDFPLKRQGGLFILETASDVEEREYCLPVPVARKNKKKKSKTAELESSSDESFQDAKTELTPVKNDSKKAKGIETKVSVGEAPAPVMSSKTTWSQVTAKGTAAEAQEWKIVTPRKKRSQSDSKGSSEKKIEQKTSPSKTPKTRYGRTLKEPDRFMFT